MKRGYKQKGATFISGSFSFPYILYIVMNSVMSVLNATR